MRKYEWKTKPYKHQVQAIRKLVSNGYGGALLMEPRTGKTKTTIDYLSVMASAGKLDRAVIIAPARVLDVWVQEFHAHCPLLHTVIVWDAKARKEGRPPAVRAPYQLTVLLVNYDAFATPGKKLRSGRRSKSTGRYATRAAILKWLDGRPAACVLDESHKIKSPSGKISTLVVSMGTHFKYRVILTGTPVTKAKRIFDVWMQWKFLNPERFGDFSNATEFKNYYGKWTNRNGFPQFLGERNTEDLRERLHEDAFAVTRAECFDLPPRTTQVTLIPLSARTAQVYDDLAEQMVAEIEEADLTHLTEASIPLVLTLRLSQITGGFATTTRDSGGEIIQVGTEKLEALREILFEHIENDEKVVVAARYRSDMDAITDLCRQLVIPTFAVRGGLTRAEMTANIKAFKDIDGVGVCVLNPQAGGLGIDLSTAAHMVWYSLTSSWVDYTQANDRIALSSKATTYTYLLAKGTVDELLFDTLQKDGDVARAVLEDPRKVLRQ